MKSKTVVGDTSTDFQDVGAFHKKFGLPHLDDGEPPGFAASDVMTFRLKFLDEEMAEIRSAYEEGDLAKFLDGLVDLSYVAKGTAHLCHLPYDEAWSAVQEANLTKERAVSADDSRSKRGHGFDVVKPINWVEPNVNAIIENRRNQLLK